MDHHHHNGAAVPSQAAPGHAHADPKTDGSKASKPRLGQATPLHQRATMRAKPNPKPKLKLKPKPKRNTFTPELLVKQLAKDVPGLLAPV